jgi:hypothetical protein
VIAKGLQGQQQANGLWIDSIDPPYGFAALGPCRQHAGPSLAARAKAFARDFPWLGMSIFFRSLYGNNVCAVTLRDFPAWFKAG